MKIVSGREVPLSPSEIAEKTQREAEWLAGQAQRNSEALLRQQREDLLKNQKSSYTLQELSDRLNALLKHSGF